MPESDDEKVLCGLNLTFISIITLQITGSYCIFLSHKRTSNTCPNSHRPGGDGNER